MARQIRKGRSRTEASRGDPVARSVTRPSGRPAADTDRLLDEIDAVLDGAAGCDPDDEAEYPVLHRWLGYLCVTMFIWILIVSALGAPVLWIRYGFE